MPTEEMSLARDIPVPIDCGTNLADILSNALPPDKRAHDKDKTLSDSSVSFFPLIEKKNFHSVKIDTILNQFLIFELFFICFFKN